MAPFFLVEETTVRESGESEVFDTRELSHQDLLLTFSITHAVENQSIAIDIWGSGDGVFREPKPLVSFTPKFYCGTYQLVIRRSDIRYFKAAWKVSRWSRADRPFFRFYIYAEHARNRAVVAGAA
ncbi:MAG TPA: hypothetical protein VHY84_19555 [Bryobacteraceae bacterium]|jgi:hypothetical protein|nr:hypothetical protein [Bryobacteraceae bacterium]